jgi:hypothetical protein
MKCSGKEKRSKKKVGVDEEGTMRKWGVENWLVGWLFCHRFVGDGWVWLWRETAPAAAAVGINCISVMMATRRRGTGRKSSRMEGGGMLRIGVTPFIFIVDFTAGSSQRSSLPIRMAWSNSALL